MRASGLVIAWLPAFAALACAQPTMTEDDDLEPGDVAQASGPSRDRVADSGWNLHTPEEIGIDDFQSSRAPDGRYRTTPLRGLWTHGKGATTTMAGSPHWRRLSTTTTASSRSA